MDVGLPTSNPLEFTFYHDERLLTPITRGQRSYLSFGDDTATVPFAIEAGQDAVCTLYPDGPFAFVNSTLADFMYSYGLLASHMSTLINTPVREREPLLNDVRDLIALRDPDALDTDGLLSWWELVLEKFEEG